MKNPVAWNSQQQHQEQQINTFRILKANNFQTRMLYEIKLSIKYEGRIKTFSVQAWYQNICHPWPIFKESLKDVLYYNEKEKPREKMWIQKTRYYTGEQWRRRVKEDPRIFTSCHSVTQEKNNSWNHQETHCYILLIWDRMYRRAWPRFLSRLIWACADEAL